MPYIKTADGKWVAGTLRRKDGAVAVQKRLLLVDNQVDKQNILKQAALDTVVVVDFDSEVNGLSEVLDKVREAHSKHGMPFASVAFANHGGQEWKITPDLVVQMADTHSAVKMLRPLLDTLVSVLDKTDFGVAHIDLLACSLAKIQPALIPALEKMYKVDFRGSTNVTGNASNNADWKLETDSDYDFSKAYLDQVQVEQYQEVMRSHSACYAWVSDSRGKHFATKKIGESGQDHQWVINHHGISWATGSGFCPNGYDCGACYSAGGYMHQHNTKQVVNPGGMLPQAGLFVDATSDVVRGIQGKKTKGVGFDTVVKAVTWNPVSAVFGGLFG